MKLAIAGTGYVGLSLAVLLAGHNDVVAVDVVQEKVNKINQGISPIEDKEINKRLPLVAGNRLTATLDSAAAYRDADFIIIATPTDYNSETGVFDTSSIESVLKIVEEVNPKGTVVIKSTVPVGYLESIKDQFKIENLLFSPEFLREGFALYDNLHPSRIVVGIYRGSSHDLKLKAYEFAQLLHQGAEEVYIPIRVIDSTEAESIKLFSNTYLAMRVSFFNELDTYAMEMGIDPKEIIEGMCLDPRIGKGYNNPSFGYGGYCLPKDTKQLLANYKGIPQSIIKAIVESNDVRKNYIVQKVLERKPKKVGIFRLIMKANSDNFRSAAIIDILKILKENSVEVVVYEPNLDQKDFEGCQVESSFPKFVEEADVILANRMSNTLKPFAPKILTRDIFNIE